MFTLSKHEIRKEWWVTAQYFLRFLIITIRLHLFLWYSNKTFFSSAYNSAWTAGSSSDWANFPDGFVRRHVLSVWREHSAGKNEYLKLYFFRNFIYKVFSLQSLIGRKHSRLLETLMYLHYNDMHNNNIKSWI